MFFGFWVTPCPPTYDNVSTSYILVSQLVIMRQKFKRNVYIFTFLFFTFHHFCIFIIFYISSIFTSSYICHEVNIRHGPSPLFPYAHVLYIEAAQQQCWAILVRAFDLKYLEKGTEFKTIFLFFFVDIYLEYYGIKHLPKIAKHYATIWPKFLPSFIFGSWVTHHTTHQWKCIHNGKK